jgi:hypothetical protein
MVTKEWTLKFVKSFLEKVGIGIYFIVMVFAPLLKKKLKPLANALVWVLVRIAALLWYMTANIFLGKKGTKKALDKNYRASKEVKWINFDPIPVCIWGACFLLLSLVIIPKTSPIEPAKSHTSDVSIGISDDYHNPDSQNSENKPRMAYDGERYYFTYDFSEVKYDESYLSVTERDYLILCVQHECGHTGSIFLECNDYGLIQRSLSKSFLNQRKNLGYTTVMDTISDTQIFSSLKPEIDTIYAILSNGGDVEDLRAAGVLHPELYDLNDKVTINNVETVIYNLDDVPDNALFWGNRDGYGEEDAYATFLTYFSENANLTNYLSVMVKDYDSPNGYHWMLFAQDNNFNPDI